MNRNEHHDACAACAADVLVKYSPTQPSYSVFRVYNNIIHLQVIQMICISQN